MRKDVGIVARVLATRRETLRLVEPLATDDFVAQSMPDASPAKWHLAHTTWFFERFVLGSESPYDYLFNSYYESVGKRQPRALRGLLTRPTVAEVMEYRRSIDARLADLTEGSSALELGLNHEQQHQELLLTDIKHLFGQNPLFPAYRKETVAAPAASKMAWIEHPGGVVTIGHDGRGFSFDNERPRHDVLLRPFAIASRPVACAEYKEFIDDGGYRRPELWLSDGWAWVHATSSRAPMYWQEDGRAFSLEGVRPLHDHEPVCHVSFYEADAYSRWAGARLPTEAEWEVAATMNTGAVWEWTASAYLPYPGFVPLEGAFGEYNGKFMVNQMVLRGGSCATPKDHVRRTYRNFFPPSAQWQFSGIRLAKDVVA